MEDCPQQHKNILLQFLEKMKLRMQVHPEEVFNGVQPWAVEKKDSFFPSES